MQGTKGNVMDAIRENGLKQILSMRVDRHRCSAIKTMRRKTGSNAIFCLEERMACGIGSMSCMYARRKKKIITVMCITKRICKDGPGIFVNGGGNLMNTKVTIAGVEWNNPVTVASGTFGSGAVY